MKQHKVTSNLDSRSVISFPFSNTDKKLPKTLKVETLRKALSSFFTNYYANEASKDTLKKHDIYLPNEYEKSIDDETETVYQNWWEDGFECEALKLGSHDWQRGKVRLKATIEIEFIPEEEPTIDEHLGNHEISDNSLSSLEDIRNLGT